MGAVGLLKTVTVPSVFLKSRRLVMLVFLNGKSKARAPIFGRIAGVSRQATEPSTCGNELRGHPIFLSGPMPFRLSKMIR